VLIGTCLITPYLHLYDLSILLAGALIVLRGVDRLTGGVRLIVLLAVSAGWALPKLVMPLGEAGLPISPLLIAGILAAACLPHVGDREGDRQVPLRRLLLRPHHGAERRIRPANVIAQAGEPQGLGADAAGGIQDARRAAPPLGAQDAVQGIRLPLDAGVPILVDQVVVGRKLAVGVDRAVSLGGSYPEQGEGPTKLMIG